MGFLGFRICGNKYPSGPLNCLISSNIFTACGASGTWWVFLIFIFSAGTVQSGSTQSRLNSFHSANLSSFVLAKVRIINLIASFVGGKAETSSAILCRSSGNSLGVIEACDFGCGFVNTLRNPLCRVPSAMFLYLGIVKNSLNSLMDSVASLMLAVSFYFS